MSKVLQKLQRDESAAAIVRRAHLRDARWGSGDSLDFALFVVDETRKDERLRRSTDTGSRRRK